MSKGHLPHRPVLATTPAACCRCGADFEADLSAPLHGDDGALIRGPRRLHRLCPTCRHNDGVNHWAGHGGYGGRRDVNAEG